MTWVLILAIVFLTTMGQLLLKLAAVKNSKLYLLSGYFLFVLVVIASYFLMGLIEFKYFTVIMSLNYITVFIFSVIFFKETINTTKAIGIALVTVGVMVFGMKG